MCVYTADTSTSAAGKVSAGRRGSQAGGLRRSKHRVKGPSAGRRGTPGLASLRGCYYRQAWRKKGEGSAGQGP